MRKKPRTRAPALAPTVRLALANGQAERNGTSGFERTNTSLSRPPGLLVSFVYLKPFLANRDRFQYRDWVLDSGAFSAHMLGITIDLDAYIETCRELLASDPTLTEVYALDVIGDHKASRKNADAMWKAGIPAVPCYHIGEPESALLSLAKTFPKIALGGVALRRGNSKLNWAAQCFARVWPKRIHGFGFGSRKDVLALPWHSVDATNWESGPCRFGQWKRYGRMSVKGSFQNLRSEVEDLLTLEAHARIRWRRQMAELDALDAPVVRVACAQQRDTQTVRLVNAMGGK